jgi:hypothetical protein
MAGGYVLVSRQPEGPVLIYADVTEDLGDGWRETWDIAQTHYDNVQVFIHRTVSRQTRDTELADILTAYDPPLNRMLAAPRAG